MAIVIIDKYAVPSQLVEFASADSTMFGSIEGYSPSPVNGPVRPQQGFLIVHKHTGCMPEDNTLKMDVMNWLFHGPIQLDKVGKPDNLNLCC